MTRRSFRMAWLGLGMLALSGMTLAQAQNPALPSGLAPVSQLMVEDAKLALDSSGNLFRSADHGKHWKRVHPQWSGKAVELLGIPSLTSDTANAHRQETSAPQPSFAAVLLKSSTAMHWVSVDRGKTWQPSTLDDVRRNDVKWSGD